VLQTAKLLSQGPEEGTAMAEPIFPDRKFLIRRAELCSSIARTFSDPLLREKMLEIARGYEELAKNAEPLSPFQSIKVGRHLRISDGLIGPTVVAEARDNSVGERDR
jgi:hypothetical protein